MSTSLAGAERVQVKLFAAPGAPESAALIPVFHEWISRDLLGDEELLIDVADYSHVEDGPGVVLVGHGADWSYDEEQGRRGLLFFRKRAFEGSLQHRLEDALRRALAAAGILARDPRLPSLAFDARELLVRVPDRLRAPNDDASFTALVPMIVDAVHAVLGTDVGVGVRREDVGKGPLTARVSLEGAPAIAQAQA
ncbi:MAG: hypothetical protein AAGH15_02880 [Myxococcota bacterium]